MELLLENSHLLSTVPPHNPQQPPSRIALRRTVQHRHEGCFVRAAVDVPVGEDFSQLATVHPLTSSFITTRVDMPLFMVVVMLPTQWKM
ncbi:hypothetical protein AHAS_Ahas09G0067900 [Arachis hypogaea]